MAPRTAPVTDPEPDPATTVVAVFPAGLSNSTGFLLGKAAQRAVLEFEGRLRPFGLRSREYGVLSLIQTAGPQSQQAIGEALRIDRTTMVNVIDGLERRNLVTRIRDPRDRRKYAITLTPDGIELLDTHLVGLDDEVNSLLTEALDDAEHRQLNALLLKMLGAA